MLVNTICNGEDLRRNMFEDRREYFSYYGYDALFNYYDSFEDPIEFDCIAICCDWTEEGEEYIRENYSNIDDISNAENIDKLVDALNLYTYAKELANGNILYMDF